MSTVPHFPGIAPRGLTTSFSISPQMEEAKTESLKTQYEYMNLLRRRHQQWMNSSDDPHMRAVHLEVAALLEDILAHYRRLFELLQRPLDDS